jgi:hypothetical protein
VFNETLDRLAWHRCWQPSDGESGVPKLTLFAAENHVLDSFHTMLSIQMMPASTPKLDDLALKSKLDAAQFNKIITELDFVTIAIAAITPVDRLRIEQLTRDLQLESIGSDWIEQWFVGAVAARSQIAAAQLRAIVLIIGQLARDRQTLVRQNISNWQQTVRHNQLPLQSPSLADYIGNFITIYQSRFGNNADLSFELLSETALNLSIDLLFYSSPNGDRRLWEGLWQRSQSV